MNKLILGDALEVLPAFAADSIDLVLTSPPYYQQRRYNGLGMGQEATIAAYVDNLLAIFAECLRVIKPTGSIIFNLGDKWIARSQQLIPYRFALAVLDRFDVILINDVTWLKPNGVPKIQDGQRLTNQTERFFVFGKDRYYFDPEPFRGVKCARSYKPGPRLGDKYRAMIKSLPDHEQVEANAVLDQLIAEVADGTIEGFRMKIRGLHQLPWRGLDSGAKRKVETRGFHVMRLRGIPGIPNVIVAATDCRKMGVHPAVYPIKLADRFVRGFCPVNGMVLDPFMGSGSTAFAAVGSGRRFTGIEIEPAYYDAASLDLALWLDSTGSAME